MNSQIAFGLFCVIAGLGAWFDFRERRIPNWLCAVAALGGLTWAFASAGWGEVPLHLAHLAVALVLGMGIYAMKYWGGGDAKFYAGLAAWFPIATFFALVLFISAFGLLLVFVAFAIRKRRGSVTGMGPLPYGIAIAAGSLTSFLILAQPF